MEASGQLYRLLYPRVPIESDVVLAPEPIWTFWRRDKLLSPDGFEPRIFQPSVMILTTISRLSICGVVLKSRCN